MKMLRLISAALLICTPAFTQLNDCYRSVDRLIWVAQDVDVVTQKWQKTGVAQIGRAEKTALKETRFRGRSASGMIRYASGQLAGAQILWIQPLSGSNAYSEFLAKHGDGVLALMHRLPTPAALDQEVKRLQALGIQVLQEGSIPGSAGVARYALMDTAAEGKYILGLIHDPETSGAVAPVGGELKLSQYAFVVRDMRSVSAYWKKLGLPEMSYTHGMLRNLQYRGRPGEFDQELGWQRHGRIVFEWIQALKGPTVYEDFLEVHGEGFHHLAFDVPDMNRAVDKWKMAGYANAQSGAWGDEAKPGSGRFAYIDTESIGGVVVELLWNFR